MDLPSSDPGLVNAGPPLIHCDHFDVEAVRETAQLLLRGLAAARVDYPIGIFKCPDSVVVGIRMEMVDYLTQRSKLFVAEAVGNPYQAAPTEIISNFVDDFPSSKRNWLNRVLGLSGSRVDEFEQGNGLWFMGRREAIARALLKNVDINHASHCSMRFDTAQELAEHKAQCNFRPVSCENEGCNARISVVHTERHDSVCPHKVLPCKQKCSERIVRREMDRHCRTVCSMRLVKCPFHQDGCRLICIARELAEHKAHCNFRPVNCMIEGCKAVFPAVHAENHDSVCPYKVLPCNQKCSEWIMRREMDKHCRTTCPMKLVKCHFHQVGCQSIFPQCFLETHCSEFLGSHLLDVLQAHKEEKASVDELKQRVRSLEQIVKVLEDSKDELKRRVKLLNEVVQDSIDGLKRCVRLLEKSQSSNEFPKTVDVRSVTLVVKEQEAKMKIVKAQAWLARFLNPHRDLTQISSPRRRNLEAYGRV